MTLQASLVLTEAEAAQALSLSVRTLQRLRLDGEGPRFLKLTGRRIGYANSDLHAWIQGRVVTSTSAATVAAGADAV
jgi:predicted DNA-binding transcriptional regulator AlpA